MAASIVGRRSVILCTVLRGLSSFKYASPAISQCNVLQIANYNPKPLKFNIRDPYIPDKTNEKTPEWQKTDKFERKLFGRYGFVSGVCPAKLWPSHEELVKLMAEEKEFEPSLEEMLRNIAVKQNEKAKKLKAKETLIAANMAKMPKMVEDWRRESRALKAKQRGEKARRERLLAEARERFGYALDPRSPKFLEMVKEIEKEETKKRKLLKRRAKQGEPPGSAAASATNAPQTTS